MPHHSTQDPAAPSASNPSKTACSARSVIAPPGGGVGFETIHQHPQQGVIGLNTAEAQSNGVVNWQRTD